ncbi:MAG: hypothetical protein M1546_01660 [Chloroflexi bacterium]|nr:hypothetical protein [Chloroflexota bacterium]
MKNLLDKQKQQDLLLYFGSVERDDIAAALAQEIDVFAVDACEACRRWGMVYPHAIETDIRAYLTGQGFAVKLTAEG